MHQFVNLAQMDGRLVAAGKQTGDGSPYIPVTFEFSNRADVAPGSFVETYLLTAPRQGVVTVPVSALTDEQGHETARFWQQPGEQVLSRATANKMKYLLHEVVARGTAQAANITSAQAGAKTGTAESRRQGRELLNYWIAGFYPLEEPGLRWLSLPTILRKELSSKFLAKSSTILKETGER